MSQNSTHSKTNNQHIDKKEHSQPQEHPEKKQHTANEEHSQKKQHIQVPHTHPVPRRPKTPKIGQGEKKQIPVPGGYHDMDIKDAVTVEKYLLQNLEGFKQLKLISYQKQTVNGYHHLLRYHDKQNAERVIIVYQNMHGDFKISADEVKKSS